MRMRKKKNLDSRMQGCIDNWIQAPEEYKGRWRELLTPDCELRLELGCGKGRFTCESAAAEPEVLFVAVERVPDAMVIAMERAREMGLKNVFFVDADAARLQDYFEAEEVDRVYLNFSDPWPSHKHSKRRLSHPNFLNRYAAVMRLGGEIHMKTDNRDLFEWSLFQFPKVGYELQNVTRDLHGNGPVGIMTDYEQKFHEQGKPICRLEAVLKERIVLAPAAEEPEEETEEE